MKSKNDFNNDILATINIIHNKYPELLNYLSEMTITIPDTNCPEISNIMLKEYNDSLRALLKQYKRSHWFNQQSAKNILAFTRLINL